MHSNLIKAWHKIEWSIKLLIRKRLNLHCRIWVNGLTRILLNVSHCECYCLTIITLVLRIDSHSEFAFELIVAKHVDILSIRRLYGINGLIIDAYLAGICWEHPFYVSGSDCHRIVSPIHICYRGWRNRTHITEAWLVVKS